MGIGGVICSLHAFLSWFLDKYVTVYSPLDVFYFMSFIITLHTISLCVLGLQEARKGRLNYCVDRCACAGGGVEAGPRLPWPHHQLPAFLALVLLQGQKRGGRGGGSMLKKVLLKGTQAWDFCLWYFVTIRLFPSKFRKCSWISSVGVDVVYSALCKS